MSSVSKGEELGDLTQVIYKRILATEGFENINVKKKVTLTGRSGATSEFDIYWEYKLAGMTNKVAIECKNYSRKVSVRDIRDFSAKIDDFKDIRGIFITKIGYQKGAEQFAKSNKISLKLLQSVDEMDWEGKIRDIIITINAIMPIQLKTEFFLKKEYLNGRPESDLPKHAFINSENDMIIYDLYDQPFTSISEITKDLKCEEYGKEYTYIYKNDDDSIFIHDINGKLLKIDGLCFKYSQEYITHEIKILAKDYILAYLLDYTGDEPSFLCYNDNKIREIEDSFKRDEKVR